MDAPAPAQSALERFAADQFAIDGKFAAPEEHAQLLVIGAGPAGLTAATEAARLGLRVVLIDENPVPAALMGMDVPLFYGQRMTPAVQASSRMVERLVASSATAQAFEAAFDAGVDLRLGVAAWGAFVNGEALAALPGRVVGLTDGARSWLCGFDCLIFATGARDLVLGFEGIELPGVMGALALHSLLTRYDAFSGRRLVILGSGEIAVGAAHAALDRGLEVAALVEALPHPQADADSIAALTARGVRLLTGTCIVRAEADADGVCAAWLAPTGAGEAPGAGKAPKVEETPKAGKAPVAVETPELGETPGERLECDTICVAIGAVPAIELAGALGLRLEFRGDLGGHVPLTDACGATSYDGVFCVGDCAGIIAGTDRSDVRASDAGGGGYGDRGSGDSAAFAEVARAAAAWLRGEPQTTAPAKAAAGADTTGYRLDWMRALIASSRSDTVVCLCEEVSRTELLGIRPPRYLACSSERMAARGSRTLLQDGPLNADQIKRLTRAGMGPCQGRRCREQIAMLLALASDQPVGSVRLASYRPPVRPLPLGVLADTSETPSMRQGWDVWFGIRAQWVPHALIGTEAEARLMGDDGMPHA